MKRDELLAQIKSGTIKDIYLFYGQETYLMQAALEEIKKVLEEQSRAAGGDLDYINADGREINGEQALYHGLLYFTAQIDCSGGLSAAYRQRRTGRAVLA